MKKDLLIVYKGPFGTLIDAYKWCQYLKDDFNIKFVELVGENGLSMEGINIIKVSNSGHRIIRGVRFILTSLYHILTARDNIIIIYFDGCSIFKKLIPWKKMILDIRTLSVAKDEEQRLACNKRISKACKLYDIITIIQKDLISELGVEMHKFFVVPLGADVISNTIKEFKQLHLLYVGTLEGRRISDTIKGLSIFLNKNPGVKISYDIIGDGITEKKEDLENLVEEEKLEKVVHIRGRLPYNLLSPFFDKCNIGVSYVPMTEWYDHQPPTKTFEYILSGLFCLATSTTENKKLITPANGLLHDDNPISFANAINETVVKLNEIDSLKVRESIKDSTWKEIVNHNLRPVLYSNSYV